MKPIKENLQYKTNFEKYILMNEENQVISQRYEEYGDLCPNSGSRNIYMEYYIESDWKKAVGLSLEKAQDLLKEYPNFKIKIWQTTHINKIINKRRTTKMHN